MPVLIDLSHDFADNMPGFKVRNADGTLTALTAHIRPFFTHEQSKPRYNGLASFEITEITFHSSIGTYLDSPFHRHPERRDISQIRLDEVILPGVVADVRGRAPWEAIGMEALPAGLDVAGKAVLLNFGWDKRWGADSYLSYPFLGHDVLQHLMAAGAKLVGVDTPNIDDSRDLSRPAHTWLLERDILIVENLTLLEQLHGRAFRFFGVPLKAVRVAALSIRAFAEVSDEAS
jgi:kynurenine formamidase